MMFTKVKTKLTSIYTLSLLFSLICFIGLLYILISQEINDNDKQDLQTFFEKENSHFIEDLYEKEHKGIQYGGNRGIFYYIYNSKNEFVYGEESIQNLYAWINEQEANSHSMLGTKKTEWNGYHIHIMKKSLETNGYTHGFVFIGKDITSEQHLIEKITWTLFFLTLLFSLIYGFLGYYFAGQAMKPIRTAFQKQEKFVSDASHELRTPLSVFYSSVDLLLREEKRNLSAFGQEVLSDVKIEAELMNKLINDLLLLARNDQQQLFLEKKKVDLSSLLASVCERFSRTADSVRKFHQEIEADIYFTCDEIRIQQLLYILLDNAFRYTNKGSITVSLKATSEAITITIQDTGVGIAEKDLPFLFDRFYRGDHSREKGGTGLGLAIAKTIVDAHGGEIKVTSQEGVGSSFIILFKKV